MTTAIESSQSQTEFSSILHSRRKESQENPTEEEPPRFIDLGKEIFLQMVEQQKVTRNYIESYNQDNLRTNFISWLLRFSTKTEVSNEVLFNTIALLDELSSRMQSDIINDPANFQLLAITCFFLSYKLFSKKSMTIAFVQKHLLCNNWKESDIRNAEIFVLETLEYNIHSINFFSFYQIYELLIKKHFKDEKFRQISFLVNFTMRQTLLIKDIMFTLTPLEQIKIILNTVLLLEHQLTGLDLSEYEAFFIELASLPLNQPIYEFEKYSAMLISNLRLTEDLMQKFSRLQ